MYTLYTDKKKVFSCNVNISGASLNESQARMIIESDDLNIIYNGKIYENGICEVDIDKLNNVLKENTNGKIKLEIIVDNTLFVPWESDFTVETERKVSISEIKDVVKSGNGNEKVIKEDNKRQPVNVSVDIKEDKKSNKVNTRIDHLMEHASKLKGALNNKNLRKKMNEEKIIASYKKLNDLSNKEIKYIKNKIK